MTSIKNDYSLLRPFDLEAAKAGDILCDRSGRLGWEFVAGPDKRGYIATKNNNTGLFIHPNSTLEFRMAPLAWVEGRPVYKGDVLFSRVFHDKHPKGLLITGKHPNDYLSWKSIGNGRESVDGYGFSALTWNPPKVKREGWIAINTNDESTGPVKAFCSHILETKEQAQNYKVDSFTVIKVEWEEEAK